VLTPPPPLTPHPPLCRHHHLLPAHPFLTPPFVVLSAAHAGVMLCVTLTCSRRLQQHSTAWLDQQVARRGCCRCWAAPRDPWPQWYRAAAQSRCVTCVAPGGRGEDCWPGPHGTSGSISGNKQQQQQRDAGVLCVCLGGGERWVAG
jgi:hypothetical protein